MEENNKKIVAEFMECKNFKDYGNNFTFEHPTKTKMEWSNRFQDNIETNMFSTSFDPFYNNDWNWLMKVGNKINNILDEYLKKYIEGESDLINDFYDLNLQNITYYEGELRLTTDINLVYLDFIEFINFYNKQEEE